ncbi:30S ribosomal protein S8 [SAR202 cluster bacterium AD-804-J14_MRT_500m]|nr:30S ribosomal protein S8 [SAR202 cluster bacterium AD-804-J14_MRT_500m]
MTNTNDPISDMLTRIRNAVAVKHSALSMPLSKVKVSIAEILKREGYIRDFEVIAGKPQGRLRVHLLYREGKEPAISGLRRVSKPGLRIYVGKGEIPRVYGGLGTAIVSTSHGLLTGREAWRKGSGGELLCYVW